MIKNLYVKDLIEHLAQNIKDTFYLKSVQLKETSINNIPYLLLKLEDKTGSVWGKIWEGNIVKSFLNLKNSVVTVYGEVILNDLQQLEFAIWKIEPAVYYSIQDYINGLSAEEAGEYLRLIDNFICKVKHIPYQTLLESFYKDNKDNFQNAPGSLSHVGNYNGGLLVQTVCVTSLSLQMMLSLNTNCYLPDLSMPYQSDLLITGSLLFSVGIMDLYSPYPEAQKIDEAVLLPKPVLSICKIEETLSKHKIYLSREERSLLFHLVHVAYDNGTIKPMNREALLLNNAYHLYNKVGNFNYYIKNNQSSKGAIYDNGLNNYLYLNKEKTNE